MPKISIAKGNFEEVSLVSSDLPKPAFLETSGPEFFDCSIKNHSICGAENTFLRKTEKYLKLP